MTLGPIYGRGRGAASTGTMTFSADGFLYTGDPLTPAEGDWRQGEVDGHFVDCRFESGEWRPRSKLGVAQNANNFIMGGSDGGLLFATEDGSGSPWHNLIKPSIDGRGTVLGNAGGRVGFITNSLKELWHCYTVNDTLVVNNAPDVTVENPGVTTITVSRVWPQNESVESYGIAVKEVGISWRATILKAGTTKVIVQTHSDFEFANGEREALTVDHSINGFSEAPLLYEWPITKGIAVDVVYEFASPVTMLGAGTVGVDWTDGWWTESKLLTFNAVPSHRRYVDGDSYEIGEWLTDPITEKVYKSKVAGIQTGTFASNSALWTEIGIIPAVMTYKGGISVVDFNALASGTEGDFYRIGTAGTLTGGQPAVVGDQVVINKTISALITVGDFDYFPNQESGVVIPPWSAKTWNLDEAILEGGLIYYATVTGVQTTSFASNAASWSTFPRLASNVVIDIDNVYDIGSSGRNLKNIFMKGSLKFGSELRVSLDMTETIIKSPNGLSNVAVSDTGTVITRDFTQTDAGGIERISAKTAFNSVFKSPDGTNLLTLSNFRAETTNALRIGSNLEFLSKVNIKDGNGVTRFSASDSLDGITEVCSVDNTSFIRVQNDLMVIQTNTLQFNNLTFFNVNATSSTFTSPLFMAKDSGGDRIGYNTVKTELTSPDGLATFTVTDASTDITSDVFAGKDSTGDRLVYDTLKTELTSPDGLQTLTVTDAGIAVNSTGEIPTINVLTYAFSSVEFIGTRGHPIFQGWTDDSIGSGNVTIVSDNVFGVTRDVVKIFDDTSSTAGISSPLTLTKMTNVQSFGASFKETMRLDILDGDEGLFVGIQANAPENPLDGFHRRYGMIVDAGVGGFMRFTGVGAGSTLSFTSAIPRGDYFTYEIVVPVGLGAADLWVNGVLVDVGGLAFAVNVGGLGSKVLLSSGSSSGTNRVTYHSEAVFTIYEESSTKTLNNIDFDGFKETVLIYPPGLRDYITQFGTDITGRNMGDKFTKTKLNIGGTITLIDLSVPAKITINGLNSITTPTEGPGNVVLTNMVAGQNIWRTFKTDAVVPDVITETQHIGAAPMAITSAMNGDEIHIESTSGAGADFNVDDLEGGETFYLVNTTNNFTNNINFDGFASLFVRGIKTVDEIDQTQVQLPFGQTLTVRITNNAGVWSANLIFGHGHKAFVFAESHTKNEIVVDVTNGNLIQANSDISASVAITLGSAVNQWRAAYSPNLANPVATGAAPVKTEITTDTTFNIAANAKYVDIQMTGQGGPRGALKTSTNANTWSSYSPAGGTAGYVKIRMTKEAFDREFPSGMSVVQSVDAVLVSTNAGGVATGPTKIFLKDGVTERANADNGDAASSTSTSALIGIVSGGNGGAVGTFAWTSSTGIQVIQNDGTPSSDGSWIHRSVSQGLISTGGSKNHALCVGANTVSAVSSNSTGIFTAIGLAGKGFGWGAPGLVKTGDVGGFNAGALGGSSVCIVEEFF